MLGDVDLTEDVLKYVDTSKELFGEIGGGIWIIEACVTVGMGLGNLEGGSSFAEKTL